MLFGIVTSCARQHHVAKHSLSAILHGNKVIPSLNFSAAAKSTRRRFAAKKRDHLLHL